MTISVRTILHTYAGTLFKTWVHDRSKTVGASEIGKCARQTYFDKRGTIRDVSYIDGFGYRLRGDIIENSYFVPAVRSSLPEGWRAIWTGDEQTTLSDGWLSATPDGLFINDALGKCIVVEDKSIDPRADLRKPKPEHAFQAQVQMGLIRKLTNYQPDEAIIAYIDASDYGKITEFVVPFDPKIFAAAEKRAEKIMTATSALDLPPEGKTAGGRECSLCAWASNCAAVTIAGVPRETRELSESEAGELQELCAAAKRLAETNGFWDAAHKKAVEDVKQFMRDHNVRKHKGEDWSISYSTGKGRETLDIAAIEAAGIDLSPYYKTGNPSERITIK